MNLLNNKERYKTNQQTSCCFTLLCVNSSTWWLLPLETFLQYQSNKANKNSHPDNLQAETGPREASPGGSANCLRPVFLPLCRTRHRSWSAHMFDHLDANLPSPTHTTRAALWELHSHTVNSHEVTYANDSPSPSSPQCCHFISTPKLAGNAK